MTEHSTFLPDSPIRVRFDPVLELLDALEKEHGPSLRVEIIDEAMRIYDDLRPVMDRMMSHRGTAEIEAFGVIRRGEFTFALLVKRDEMVVVEIVLGSPPFPDPDGTGAWGHFKVELGTRKRHIRARGAVAQSTDMVTRPAEPTTAAGLNSDSRRDAAACAPPAAGINALPAPAASAASASAASAALPRAQLGAVLVAVLDGLSKEHLVNSMIGVGGSGSVVAWILDESKVHRILDSDLREFISSPNEYESDIHAFVASIISAISNLQISDKEIYANHTPKVIKIVMSCEYITKCERITLKYMPTRSLVLNADELKSLTSSLSCEAESRSGFTAPVKLRADVADVAAWLVSVHDKPLRADVTCEADHRFVSDLRARFRLSAIAMHRIPTVKEAGDFAATATYEAISAEDGDQTG